MNKTKRNLIVVFTDLLYCQRGAEDVTTSELASKRYQVPIFLIKLTIQTNLIEALNLITNFCCLTLIYIKAWQKVVLIL